jgi:hypothetical protein
MEAREPSDTWAEVTGNVDAGQMLRDLAEQDGAMR